MALPHSTQGWPGRVAPSLCLIVISLSLYGLCATVVCVVVEPGRLDTNFK